MSVTRANVDNEKYKGLVNLFASMAQHSLISIPTCIEKYRTVTMSLSLESVNSKILSLGIFEGESKLQTFNNMSKLSTKLHTKVLYTLSFAV